MKFWLLADDSHKKDATAILSLEGMNFIEVVYARDVTYIQDGKSREIFVKGESVPVPKLFFYTGAVKPEIEVLCSHLEHLGALCYNSLEGKRIAMSKMATNAALAKAGLPFAKTIPIMRGVSADFLIQQLGLPLIVKPDDGYAGIGVQLIKSKEELEAALLEANQNGDSSFMIAQQFVSTTFGRDVRVYMLEHKPIHAAMRRAGNETEFRSNLSTGGHYEDYELTEEDYALCVKISKTIGLNYCGLDLLFGESGFIVGEVNSSPGFTGVYKRANLIELFQKHIASI